MEAQATCARCSRSLAVEKYSLGQPARHAGAADLAIRFALPFRLFFYSLRRFFDQPPDASLSYRNPWQAAWMSFLPGGGQLYNGQPRVALLHFLLFAGLFGSGIWFILSPWSDLLMVLAASTILHSMNHALMEAQTINGVATFLGARRWVGLFLMLALVALTMWAIQYFALAWVATFLLAAFTALALATWEGRRKSGSNNFLLPAGVALLWIGLVVVFFGMPSYFWRSVVRLQWTGQVAYSPFIQKGDRILFEGVSIAWRPIQLGDIVLYDPDRYSMEVGKDLHLVNMPLSFERVVGLPGDVFERRSDGAFYLNGEPAPPLARPLCRSELPPEFRVEAPPGHYIVLMSYGPIEWMPIAGTRKAAAPGRVQLEKISAVPSNLIYGRALMIYRPWSRRRWIDAVPLDADRSWPAAPRDPAAP
jgi:hypothetical protein